MSILPLSILDLRAHDGHMNPTRPIPRTLTDRRRSAVVMVQALNDQDLFVARPARIWDVLLSQMLSGSLDRRLASGELPESNLLLATRARHLVSSRARRETATAWTHLLERSTGPLNRRIRRIRPCDERIAASRIEIEALTLMLESSGPVASRGVAIANALLGEGSGPVWNPRCAVDLSSAIQEGIRLLNPPIFETSQVDGPLR